MKVYKDKQYLVFDFEDGKTVKYDFATKQAIGIKGKPVKSLNKQLQGFTIDALFDCCVDQQYAKFLRYVRNREGYQIINIGTILSRVPFYSKYEQIFSAGFDDIIVYNGNFNYGINEIPKSLIKAAKTHNIKINNSLVKYWKQNPDAYNMAFQLEYLSLNDYDIENILTFERYINHNNVYEYNSYFNELITYYGYNAKSLLLYLDHLKTFEAIEHMSYLISELYDYARMMSEISQKFDKYPRHFLTTHKIACRNYNRLKKEFEESLFKKRINKDYECTYKDYIFIYPNCTQDIKDEATQQNNCVASYIDKVIDGLCHIMFLRKKSNPDKSLVTIEIRDNKIVQARRRFNDPVTEQDQEAIDYWDKKFKDYNKEEKEKVA